MINYIKGNRKNLMANDHLQHIYHFQARSVCFDAKAIAQIVKYTTNRARTYIMLFNLTLSVSHHIKFIIYFK